MRYTTHPNNIKLLTQERKGDEKDTPNNVMHVSVLCTEVSPNGEHACKLALCAAVGLQRHLVVACNRTQIPETWTWSVGHGWGQKGILEKTNTQQPKQTVMSNTIAQKQESKDEIKVGSTHVAHRVISSNISQ